MEQSIAKSFAGHCVLVTGGAGFVGSHLVERLLSLGARVSVVDDLSNGCLANLAAVSGSVEMMQGDLGELLRRRSLSLSRFAYVFHLAANAYIPPSVERPAFDYESNLHSTFLLLESLRELTERPRLVNTSTGGVYGNPARLPIREDDPTVPIAPYGVSKLAAERYVAVYADLYGLRANSLRLFSVYGPRQRKQVVYDFFCKLQRTPELLTVMGDGSQQRDFNYVGDAVEAFLLAATAAPGRGEALNVASGKSVTIRELAEAVCRIRGRQAAIRFTGDLRPGDADKWAVDTSRLNQLGQITRKGLSEGLAVTAQWFDGIQNS